LCLTPLAAAYAQITIAGTAFDGLKLFKSSAVGANGLSCAQCHATVNEERIDDGLIRAAHSMANAADRETWWGQDPEGPGAYANIAAAAVVCVEHYMRRQNKLTAQQLLDLEAFLSSINRRPEHDALAIAPAADKTGEYSGYEGGDKVIGRTLFYTACHTCHPNGEAGIAPAIPRQKPAAFYARKVREGDGLGAVLSGVDPNAYDPASGQFMPFFGADRLSKDQIRDIIAYILVFAPRLKIRQNSIGVFT
jgi:mono/diheme cytochrome c family protein